MRLAVNASFLNERPTGVGVFTGRVAAELASLKEETYVFSSVAVPGVPAGHMIPVPRAVRGSIRLWHNVSRLASDNSLIPLLAKRHGIDVLFCPITEFPFLGGPRLVVTVHDLHPLYFPEQFGRAADHFRFCIGRLDGAARRVVVLSGFVRDELCRRTGFPADRIDVAGCGYDDREFRPRDEDEKQRFREQMPAPEPYILYVGSLFPYKNVRTLITAFLSIKDEVPHRLVIAGKREVAREPLPGDRRITYLDYVPHERLPLLYACADVLVHPALFEGFGIVILEAMASGTPVISSCGGSLPEVVGDAGLLFQPEDSGALADLLRQVTGDRSLRAALAARGLERVRSFSWRQTAARILRSCERAAEAP